MNCSDIWTLSEQKNGRLHAVSFELLAWGKGLAEKRGSNLCAVVLCDKLPDEDLNELILHGADIVYVVRHADLENFLVEVHSKVLQYLVERYAPEVMLASATTQGRTVMPYLSMKLHTGLTADCTGLDIDAESGNLLQTRPAIGGNIMATIKTPEARPQMATVRPKSAAPLPADESRTGQGDNSRCAFGMFYGAHEIRTVHSRRYTGSGHRRRGSDSCRAAAGVNRAIILNCWTNWRSVWVGPWGLPGR